MSGNGAFVGKFKIQLGDGASPEQFGDICAAFSVSGIGETNDQVDATTFCSGGTREYIPGLADGQEVTIEANFVSNDLRRQELIDAVKNKEVRNFRAIFEDDSPATTFQFAAACLSWVVNPSVDSRNTITFGLKISGEVVEV